MICLSSSPSNPKVIRTAARMAEAFHSGFTALFVQTPETKELSGDNLKRLRSNLHLAEQLVPRSPPSTEPTPLYRLRNMLASAA